MASSNIARLGVVLGLDTALFTAAVQEAINTSTKLKSAIARESKAAEKEIQSLKYAIEDYGKEVSKVTILERELENGRFKSIKGTDLATKLLDQARAYDQIATSQKKMTQGLTDQQKLALTYQTTDLVTQIASGQNAMIALLQQGGQLKDQLGGIGNTFRIIGSLITPVRVAIVGLTAAVGTLAYAFYKGFEESSKFRDSLILTNNYAKLSAASFQQMAETVSGKLNVSIGNTKDVLFELIDSGKFTSGTMDSVATAILNVSKLTGQTAKDVAKSLIPAFDGSASSAKRLNDQYHFLSLAQYKQIELLEKQGKLQESSKLAADAFNNSVNGQTRQLGILEKSWETLKNAASSAWDAMLGIGRGTTVEEELKKVQDQIEKYEKLKSNQASNPEWVQKQIDEQKAKADALNEQIRLRNRALQKKDDTAAIEDYAKFNEKRLDLERQFQQLKLKNQYASLINAANDETKIVLETQEQMLSKINEIKARNEKEGFAFTVQNQKILQQELIAIATATEEKVRQLRLKRYADEMNERQQSQDQVNSDLDNEAKRKGDIYKSMVESFQLKKEELEFDREKLQLSKSLIGNSEEETKLAQLRLTYERERRLLEQNQELNAEKKSILRKQLDEQQLLAENNLALEMSVKRMGEAFDSVFNTMSNALEAFVRTGKLSFRDLIRDMIQNLLLLQMRSQMTTIFGFLKTAFMGSGNVYGAGDFHQGMPGFGGAYADGGSVPANKVSLVGERGPELFMPRSAGTIIPNSQLGGLGGTTNVTNNYINAIDVKSFEQRLLSSSNAVWAANAYAQKSLAVGRGRS